MKKQTKVASKLCIRCNRILPLGEFYPNKDWRSQQYRDAWCKECAQKYSTDKESQEQYCYENNRKWQDSFWDSALKKAQYALASNPDYLDPKAGTQKKEKLMNATAVRSFFSMMNLRMFYGYVENVANDGSFAEEKKELEEEKEKTVYDKTWGGYFTADQIETQNDRYAQYEEDFVLDNVNIRDYARKVVKASLNADIAEDKMRRGEISASEYKEAQKIFDDLSKSSNFAACKRKPGEASGLGSLGEIIMRLEIDGKLNENGFTFPADDIDKIILDFDHTLEAIGIEGRW